MDCLRTPTCWASHLPFADATHVHKHFVILSDRIRCWRILFEISSEFSLTTDPVEWLPITLKAFFLMTLHIRFLLCCCNKRWNYFLRMRAKQETFRCCLQWSAFNSCACGSLTVNSYNRSHDLFIYSLWGTLEITKYSRYEIEKFWRDS